MLSSLPLYLNDTYLYELPAKIIAISKDDRGDYIVLDQTIFYPQGGGQPSDHGTIQNQDFTINISHVRQHDQEIRHYTKDSLDDNLIGANVVCCVDKEKRTLHAKYHTAGHLISNVVEQLYPELKGIKGHHFFGEAYVKFTGAQATPDIEIISEALNKSINDGFTIRIFDSDIATFEKEFYKLPYTVPDNKAFRVMQIAEYSPCPCGGTHVANTAEIGKILLSKLKLKDGELNISYSITN